jgi:ABC-2 type transport system permease protein
MPAMLLILTFYLIFTHTLSYLIASFGFFITRTKALTAMKNMSLWVLSGELFPLDLVPPPLKDWIIHLPFASGVYVPVGFLVGRLDFNQYLSACFSLAVSTLIVGAISAVVWKRGLKVYAGTGA